MAEVGLLPFARIALQAPGRVLPPYQSRFSKRQFTQPQLLAILCLMRYEDWTFREAQVRLSEHRELRQVLGLVSGPHFTTSIVFCNVSTTRPSTARLAKRCAGCVVRCATGGSGFASPWTPRAWH